MAKKLKKSGKSKGKGSTKFCIVQWLEDDTVSVIPVTSAENEDKVYVGAIERFNWYGKFYDGEVLSVSGESLSSTSTVLIFILMLAHTCR